MAIYKPSNCMPFLDSLDLCENQDIQCELNTSNNQVVGYKIRVTDSQNNIIFEGKEFTLLNDKSLTDKYQNSGLNGSFLTLPLVVSSPEYSNKNNIFFAGNESAYWKPDYKLLSSYNTDIYFYGLEYFRLSTETISSADYALLTTSEIYAIVNGYYRTLSQVNLNKPEYSSLNDYQYYFVEGSDNNYTQIKVVSGGAGIPIFEEDYIKIKNGVYYYDDDDDQYKLFIPSKQQSIDDHAYGKTYKIINENAMSDDEYKILDKVYSRNVTYTTTNKPELQQDGVLGELYYNDYLSPFPSKPSYEFSYNRCYYKNGDDEITLIDDSVTAEYYDSQISVVYDRVVNYQYIDMFNRKIWNEGDTLSGYFQKEYYSFFRVKPSYSEAKNNYYYLSAENTFEKITEESISEETYNNSIVSVYRREDDYNPLIPSGESSYNGIFIYSELSTADDYNEAPAVYKLSYKPVAGLDFEFYNNNIYSVYKQTNLYTEEDKPSTLLAATYLQYYYEVTEPISYEYCQYMATAINDNGDIFSDNRIYVDYESNFYSINETQYTVLSDIIKNALCYIHFSAIASGEIPVTKEEAVLSNLYYSVSSNSNDYYKITQDMSENEYKRYKSLGYIYKFDGVFEYTSLDSDKIGLTQYKKIENFYNGYMYQPYKWQIDLMQGDLGRIFVEDVRSKWFDMQITNGTVLGSCPTRLHGLFSDNIYKNYYVQLYEEYGEYSPYVSFDSSSDYIGYYVIYNNNYVKVTNDNKDTLGISPGVTLAYRFMSPVGNRVLIDSYDGSFGYIYPQKGFITESDIESASYFSIYKYTNDPEYVSINRKVNYATNINIDLVQYNGATPTKLFGKQTEYSSYYTQIYDGEITLEDLDIHNYDTAANNGAINIGIGGTSILIKNQGADNSSSLNGVYYLDSLTYTYDSVNTTQITQTTINWLRTADADSYADFLNGIFYIISGSSSGINYMSDAAVGGTLDATPIKFIEENPVLIYPIDTSQTKQSEHNNYYIGIDPEATDSSGYKIVERYSPLFKNSATMTYIKPFIGIQNNMRFKYGLKDIDSVIINSIDSNVWAISHNELPFGQILKPNIGEYIISSYYKTSDENPFYAYNKPYVDIIIQNITDGFDNMGYPVIANRYVIADASYAQAQNKSWKNYEWILYDLTNDLEVDSTDTIYTGSFQQKFIGIENNNKYRLKLLIESELGYTQEVSKDFVLFANLEYGSIPINISTECLSHSVDISVLRVGAIQPIPSVSNTDIVTYDENNGYMKIADDEVDRDYCVKYSSALSYNGSVTLPPPKTNNFRAVSSHSFNPYYQGIILTYLFNEYEILDVGSYRFVLDIICEPDTFVDNNGEIVLNNYRNCFSYKFYRELYNNEGNWINDISYPDSSYGKYVFRNKQNVKFSLIEGEDPSSSNDYIYTTVPYDSEGNVISDLYNLASTEYDPMESGEENLLKEFLYPYNTTYPSYTVRTGGVNFSPLCFNEQSDEDHENSFGCWYDEKMYHNESVGMLLTDRNPSFWCDSAAEDSLFYWKDESYGFYKQHDANLRENHSGKQYLQGHKFVFDISVSNYDYLEKTGNISYKVIFWEEESQTPLDSAT